ncbi:MAG: hypothetical protein NTW05_06055 [Pseudonocardiales bacterium]|nr:hypothetical protein [Pseudonocardiales bacterium]
MTGHVVALGGGGFSTGPDRRLDDHVLSLAGVPRPRVLFVPTASDGRVHEDPLPVRPLAPGDRRTARSDP